MQASSLTPDHPEKIRRDALVLLSSVRSTLADLLDEVRLGEAGALKELGVKQSELESALKRAFEAEARYNEWQAKLGHEATGRVEIDFDALRHELACRLNRLRECCDDA